MDYRALFFSTFSVHFLVMSFSVLPTQACPRGNSRETIYLRRDDNRCEGIKPSISISSGINLISFLSRNVSEPLGSSIKLQVPRVSGSSNPVVSLRSIRKRYQLDNLSLSSHPSYFVFGWSTYVLKEAKIPLSSLRALASVNVGSQEVLIPVTIGQSSDKYEFVLYSDSRVTVSSFQISRNGEAIYTSPSQSSLGGEIVFVWNGRKKDGNIASPGRYDLKILTELDQFGRPPERIPIQVKFEHHPNWLK